jgi:hypothetical protein
MKVDFAEENLPGPRSLPQLMLSSSWLCAKLGGETMKRMKPIMIACLVLMAATLGCSLAGTSEPGTTAPPAATAPPTAAAQPTAMIPPPTEAQLAPGGIAGWVRFAGGGVEIWLPASFEGGDLEEDLPIIVERLRALGPDFEPMAQTIESNPSMYVLWAFDSEVGAGGFLTNMAVTTETIPASMGMDTYLDAALGQLPAQFQVTKREVLTLSGFEVGRVEVEFLVSGVSGKELLYVLKDGHTVWVITYATSMAEFATRLPIFEQSFGTFRVLQ